MGAIAELRNLVQGAESLQLLFPSDPTAAQLGIDARYDLGTTLIGANLSAEAEEVIATTLDLAQNAERQEPQDQAAVRMVGILRGAYAQALVAADRPIEAVTVASVLLDQRRALLERSPSDFMAQRVYQTALVILGGVYGDAWRNRDACETYRSARDFIQSPGHLQLTKLDEATNLKEALGGIELRLSHFNGVGREVSIVCCI